MEPALVLHGGPGLSDYTESFAAELEPIWQPIRYQQRGIAPAQLEGPFTIEAHVSDAIAVLDARGIEAAWLAGHSWGGHLALHILVAHPERVRGAFIVDALGAVPDGGAAEADENLTSRLSPQQATEVRRIDEALQRGETNVEPLDLIRPVWPYYFARPDEAPPLPDFELSPSCYSETFTSIREHFERGTLERGLREATRPVLFVHGRESPIPPYRSEQSAVLLPGAGVEIVDGVGHFVWLECPGSVRAALKRWLAATQRQREAAPGTLASQGEA
jgi:proline iminopeptidase